jgi:hypothetical protein
VNDDKTTLAHYTHRRLYRDLFVHRSDVFAEQHDTGAYTPVRRPLTDDDIERHLAGEASYGVYVIDPMPLDDGRVMPFGVDVDVWRPSDTVKYVVFDLDTYDKSALVFLCDAVERLVATAALQWWGGNEHRQCLMLEDSGGKGYHLWLFLSEPVPARQARAWAEDVRRAYVAEANRLAHDVVSWPALEIFPKQDTVPEGGFGNLVKLPFGVHAKSKARSFIQQRAGWAGSLEDVRPFPVSLIPEYAATSDPPHSAQRGVGGRGDGPTPFACVSKILDEGASQGVRDVAMLHLAHYARGCGLPEDVTELWCSQVNDGFDPPLTPREVATKVESAYRMAAPKPSCSADWLRDFCPGSETMRSCPNYCGDAPQSRRDRFTFGD